MVKNNLKENLRQPTPTTLPRLGGTERAAKKKSPETFVSELSSKEGGYLLSRIALQYHRR